MWPELAEGLTFPRTFGVVVMLGALGSIWMASRRAKRHGYDPEKVWDFSVALVLSGIVGARVVDVISDWDTYWGAFSRDEIGFGGFLFSLIKIWEGGMSFVGGVALAALVGILLVRRWGLPVSEWVDLVAPSFSWALGATALAHFFQGSYYGMPTDSIAGITFPADALVYAGTVMHIPEGTAVHPTQLYLALGYALIGIWLAKRFPAKRRGAIFCDFLWSSGALVFVVENWRADVVPMTYLSYELTEGQFFAAGAFAVGLVLRTSLNRVPLR